MKYEMEGARPEVDQRKLWQRFCKKTVRHVNWTRRMSCIAVDGRSR